MKLLFSEATSDYGQYLYPYVVWATPEPGETPADFYERGFLPAAPDLSRYCLCRQIRVVLSRFTPSSENRRILRKGNGIALRLIPRAEFDYSPARRDAWVAFARERFGPGVMPSERLDRVMSQGVITHLLHFTRETDGRELGTALLHLDPRRVAHYYYAFYDLGEFRNSLGLHMMTRCLGHFAALQYHAVYLGTCYSRRALYKTRFPGVEFFNGNCWSPDLDELKFLIDRDATDGSAGHLMNHADYLPRFWDGRIGNLIEAGAFRLAPVPRRVPGAE